MTRTLLASARSTEVLPMGSTPRTPGEIQDRNRAVMFALAGVRRGMKRTGAVIEDEKNHYYETLSAKLSEATRLAIMGNKAANIESLIANELGWDLVKKERQINELISYILGQMLSEREYDKTLDIER